MNQFYHNISQISTNLTGGVCEGGGFSERSPSLALPPEERLGIGLCVSSDLRAHARWGAVSCFGVVVTAADRAAATVRRVGERITLYIFCEHKTTALAMVHIVIDSNGTEIVVYR